MRRRFLAKAVPLRSTLRTGRSFHARRATARAGNAALRRFPVPVCALRAGTGTTKSFSVRKETILKENGVKMRILGNHGAEKNMKSAGFAGICRKMANSVDNRRKLAGISGKLHRLRWINARIIFIRRLLCKITVKFNIVIKAILTNDDTKWCRLDIRVGEERTPPARLNEILQK